jgi:quercetin dioxygenase-like cupin family protein
MALPHAQSGAVVDLNPRGDGGGPAQTRALVKSQSFEAIQLEVPAGKEVPAHQVAGEFTLLCLDGSVIIELADREIELGSRQWIYFEGGIRHSVRAIEDSSLLLTIIL